MRVLNVDTDARKLVLSMRQKPRPTASEQGDITKYAKMFAEVRVVPRFSSHNRYRRCWERGPGGVYFCLKPGKIRRKRGAVGWQF